MKLYITKQSECLDALLSCQTISSLKKDMFIQQYHAPDVLYKQYNSLWCMHKSAQYVPRPRKRDSDW